MVEGHGVHRVANRHKQLLLHRTFQASSPNGRFTEGAQSINGKQLYRIEAIGKNLFYFFSNKGDAATTVVVHIHFGMSGRFTTFSSTSNNPPAVKPTTRLVLQDDTHTAHLSAMTCEMGDLSQYTVWCAKLGPDPLREDADFERLWNACGVPNCRGGRASIGAVLMDQKRIAGVGNIYRAEILFKAKVHPEQPANTLGRELFERVWFHCCDLMQRGVAEGSILTLDDAHQLLHPTKRRYVYNQSKCIVCQSNLKSWAIKNRTCYGCLTCQPMLHRVALKEGQKKQLGAAQNVQVFKSRCAPEVGEAVGRKKNQRKRQRKEIKTVARPTIKKGEKKRRSVRSVRSGKQQRSAAAAAMDKILAGEGRNVEHVALVDEAALAVIDSAGQQRRKKRKVVKKRDKKKTR
jgi:formamidopyrimidine-DNA glycosylase